MKVRIENPTTRQFRTHGWAFCAVPGPLMMDLRNSAGPLVFLNQQVGVWRRAPRGVTLELTEPPGPGSVIEPDLVDSPIDTGPFQFHKEVLANVHRLIPRFMLGGKVAQLTTWLRHVDAGQFCIQGRAVFGAERITCDLWMRAWHLHPLVEYCACATYGDTRNDGQPQLSPLLPNLVMWADAYNHVMFGQDLGLRPGPAFGTRPLGPPDGTTWQRARRHSARGWLEIVWASDPTPPTPIWLCAHLQPALWDGEYCALGKVPRIDGTAELWGARARLRQAYDMAFPFRAWDRAQPAWAGTTGEQPDFGAANDLLGDAYALHDALLHCRSFEERPTANREPDGSRMLAANHPLAEVLGQRPDLGFGLGDRLGWPGNNQILPIFGYQTSGGQHHCVNLLAAAYLLTNDPLLESVIEDHIELYQLEATMRREIPEAARAEGRILLAKAHFAALGVKGAAGVLEQHVDRVLRMWEGYRHRGPVSVWGDPEQAKSGWVHQIDEEGALVLDARGDPVMGSWSDPRTRPVMGWQPWQQSILVLGLLAAARHSSRRVELEAMAHHIASVVIDHGFYACDGRWLHCYALRDNQGQALPAHVYDGTTNGSIVTETACQTWCYAAIDLIAASGETRALDIKRELFNNGEARTPEEARWWAI